jgi:photosystem II stability/assembly factor-like uncharacterized protein
VPAGFRPLSVTFVSANMGWVLGSAPCRAAPCTSVVRTVDGGRSWKGIPAPRIALALHDETAGVRGLRFADRDNGWAYGPDLYATHDGGASWHQLRLAGSVSNLEAAGGVAYAAVVDAGGTMRLYRTTVGSDAWSLAAGVPANGHGWGTITLHGRAGWLISGGRLYATTSGASWHPLASPCPARDYYFPASLAASDEQRVALLCAGNGAAGSEGKIVYSSADGGRSFTQGGTAPFHGTSTSLALPRPRSIFLATYSGASFIDASFDGGRAWHTVLNGPTGGPPWNDMGFTTAAQGVVVAGTPQIKSTLYMTRDGGHTWSPVRFTAR